MRISGILAAGGSGIRFNSTLAATVPDNLPKQFNKLKGMPVFLWSLRTMCKHPELDPIVLVAPENMIKDASQAINSYFPEIAKKVILFPGGSSRQESVYLGLKKLKEHSPHYVLIHDAARPFVTFADIECIISKLSSCNACTLGRPVSDTIKLVIHDAVVETKDRQNLFTIQTPQAFQYDLIFKEHELVLNKNIAATDDAAILEAAGYRVELVPGSVWNMKITTYDDFLFLESIADVWLSMEQSKK